MARAHGKRQLRGLVSALIAGTVALVAFLGGLSLELAGNQLTELLRGRWYAPWAILGGLGVAALIAFGYGVWAFRHQKDTTGGGPGVIALENIRDSTVASATAGSGIVASEVIHAGGPVAGRDIHITYQGGQPPSAATSLHQIPRPSDDFTGRSGELALLLDKIQGGGAAISGLRGMGGIGKTALALKLAQELAPRYPDAQLFLDLKGLDPQPLTAAEAMAYVIRSFDREARLPATEAELGALYRSVLHGQRVLLLLDNAANAQQVQPLIPPQECLLLVASRQRLDLPGLYALDLDTLPPQEARQLLLTIAPRIGGEADAIARLCGYLPLALELAARFLKLRVDLTPGEYRRRLEEARELFPEVDASLGLSYDLLTPELQQRWRTLAVFPSTFARPAAAVVWEMEPEPAHDNLGDLLGYSLVEWDPERQRYRLHDLARLYADARLGDEERAAVQQRHAAHFREILAVADRLYLEGGDRVLQGLALFDLEWGNIQAGQSWAAARAGEDDAAAALCRDYPDAGGYVLDLRQHPRERIQWLEAALAAARRVGDRRTQGNHLGNLGTVHGKLGETRRAIEHFQQSLDIYQDIGDRRGEGIALGNLGLAYADLGELRRAIEYHQQALAILREIGDRGGEGASLGNLGQAYRNLGEPLRAIEYHEQHLVITREMGDRLGEGQALGNLGSAYLVLGEARWAIEFYEQQLVITREIGDRRGEGTALWNWSLALDRLGQRPQAIVNAEAALQIFEEIEDPNAAMVRRGLERWRGQGESPPS